LVSASDNIGISRVHFFRWDKVILAFMDISTISNPPYEWNFDTTILYVGWNEIDVEAFDTSGNVSDSQYIFLYRKALVYLPFVTRR
jgi:hypothetical protein